jgi:hypothetical protein
MGGTRKEWNGVEGEGIKAEEWLSTISDAVLDPVR